MNSEFTNRETKTLRSIGSPRWSCSIVLAGLCVLIAVSGLAHLFVLADNPNKFEGAAAVGILECCLAVWTAILWGFVSFYERLIRKLIQKFSQQ